MLLPIAAPFTESATCSPTSYQKASGAFASLGMFSGIGFAQARTTSAASMLIIMEAALFAIRIVKEQGDRLRRFIDQAQISPIVNPSVNGSVGSKTKLLKP